MSRNSGDIRWVILGGRAISGQVQDWIERTCKPRVNLVQSHSVKNNNLKFPQLSYVCLNKYIHARFIPGVYPIHLLS